MKKFFQFCVAIIVSFIPGMIGTMFTPSGASDTWYNALSKSALTPDGWVFGVAWTILYALLGIALYLVIRSPQTRRGKGATYMLFAVHLALNSLWTYMFFGLHLIGGALIVLIALIAVSIWMMRKFRQFSRGASWLVWPYILWMLFALYLNSLIVYLN